MVGKEDARGKTVVRKVVPVQKVRGRTWTVLGGIMSGRMERKEKVDRVM